MVTDEVLPTKLQCMSDCHEYLNFSIKTCTSWQTARQQLYLCRSTVGWHKTKQIRQQITLARVDSLHTIIITQTQLVRSSPGDFK